MKYLIDSDWVVDYLIGKQQAIDLLLLCFGMELRLASLHMGKSTKEFIMVAIHNAVKQYFANSYVP